MAGHIFSKIVLDRLDNMEASLTQLTTDVSKLASPQPSGFAGASSEVVHDLRRRGSSSEVVHDLRRRGSSSEVVHDLRRRGSSSEVVHDLRRRGSSSEVVHDLRRRSSNMTAHAPLSAQQTGPNRPIAASFGIPIFERAALIKENLEVIEISQGMAFGIRVLTSSMATKSDTATPRGDGESETVSLGEMGRDQKQLHPHADTFSLNPVFPRRSREVVSTWANTIGLTAATASTAVDVGGPPFPKPTASGLSGTSSTTDWTQDTSVETAFDMDDGIPTEQDRQIFEDQLLEARQFSKTERYASAIVPLRILLRKARLYPFVDDAVEREISNLTAFALLELGASAEDSDRLMQLYPTVAEEMVLVGLTVAKRHSAKENYDAAVVLLEKLHNIPQICQEVEICVPDELSAHMAHCLAKQDLVGDRTTKLAEQFRAVDLYLTKARTEAALENRLPDKMQRVELARCAIDGWQRVKRWDEVPPIEEGLQQKLQLKLSQCLIGINGRSKEGRDILLQLASTAQLNVNVRAEVEEYLAFTYLYYADKWELARQHAMKAARIQSRLEGSGKAESESIEVFVIACELLGDPEGKYWASRYLKDHDRRLYRAPALFFTIQSHIFSMWDQDLGGAVEYGMRFLEQNYMGNDEPGAGPCRECIKMTLETRGCRFAASINGRCPIGMCQSVVRYPVLELLASAKPTPKSHRFCDPLDDMQLLIRWVDDSASSNPETWAPVDLERLLWLAFRRGGPEIVHCLMENKCFAKCGAPNQFQALRDCAGTPCSFTIVVPRVRYEDMVGSPVGVVLERELAAIEVFVDHLSTQGIARLLRHTFLPDGIWNPKVLAMVLRRSAKARELTSPFVDALTRKEGEVSVPPLYQAILNLRHADIAKRDPVRIVDLAQELTKPGLWTGSVLRGYGLNKAPPALIDIVLGGYPKDHPLVAAFERIREFLIEAEAAYSRGQSEAEAKQEARRTKQLKEAENRKEDVEGPKTKKGEKSNGAEKREKESTATSKPPVANSNSPKEVKNTREGTSELKKEGAKLTRNSQSIGLDATDTASGRRESGAPTKGKRTSTDASVEGSEVTTADEP